jgi:hypothetical protein
MRNFSTYFMFNIKPDYGGKVPKLKFKLTMQPGQILHLLFVIAELSPLPLLKSG